MLSHLLGDAGSPYLIGLVSTNYPWLGWGGLGNLVLPTPAAGRWLVIGWDSLASFGNSHLGHFFP